MCTFVMKLAGIYFHYDYQAVVHYKSAEVLFYSERKFAF